jgi:hypothetical protein
MVAYLNFSKMKLEKINRNPVIKYLKNKFKIKHNMFNLKWDYLMVLVVVSINIRKINNNIIKNLKINLNGIIIKKINTIKDTKEGEGSTKIDVVKIKEEDIMDRTIKITKYE